LFIFNGDGHYHTRLIIAPCLMSRDLPVPFRRHGGLNYGTPFDTLTNQPCHGVAWHHETVGPSAPFREPLRKLGDSASIRMPDADLLRRLLERVGQDVGT
jgi:hypothetical protein